LIGGHYSTAVLSDIWASTDGSNWTLITEFAPFGGRSNHCLVSYGGELFLVGGLNSNFQALGDIWASTDGRNWTLEKYFAPFGGRSYHCIVSYCGELFLIGGHNGTSVLSDIW